MTADQEAILALTKRVAELEGQLAKAWQEGAEDAVAEFSSADFPPSDLRVAEFYGSNPYKATAPR